MHDASPTRTISNEDTYGNRPNSSISQPMVMCRGYRRLPITSRLAGARHGTASLIDYNLTTLLASLSLSHAKNSANFSDFHDQSNESNGTINVICLMKACSFIWRCMLLVLPVNFLRFKIKLSWFHMKNLYNNYNILHNYII